ncbi:MAG: hypothetical protein PHX57_06005 [Desulfobulbaceae bacterium]|nr:hypothetical protein [Desulfobulbaceae bacterium]
MVETTSGGSTWAFAGSGKKVAPGKKETMQNGRTNKRNNKSAPGLNFFINVNDILHLSRKVIDAKPRSMQVLHSPQSRQSQPALSFCLEYPSFPLLHIGDHPPVRRAVFA